MNVVLAWIPPENSPRPGLAGSSLFAEMIPENRHGGLRRVKEEGETANPKSNQVGLAVGN